MKRKARLFFIAPAAIVGITLFMGIGGWIVMHLWNWLLPGIFGWRMITFWQALGMLVLCRILFGNHSWRGGPRSGMRERMRERMGARWPEMTPEQHEKMRQRWATVCGFEPPASESHES
jgi:hypothetical protein